MLCLAGATGCRGEETAGRSRESVVLITIDTLRADHLGSYGYPRDTSPFLDWLAERAVLFENAFSSSSHTAPSHASIMTALQPAQHGLLKNGQRLHASLFTAAEMFQEAGYDTAAFTSVRFLFELRQGFDVFDAGWRPGNRTTDEALAWLAAREDDPGATARPFFLWVHLYDPHKLKGPRKALEPYVPDLGSGTTEAWDKFLAYLRDERGVFLDFYPDREHLIRRFNVYDAAIRFSDEQVSRLYRRVQEISGDALWIITSDHGEGLGNHGYGEHDKFLYKEQLRVPLILAGGGGTPRRISRLVRLVDILPTFADWLGRPLDGSSPSLQGYPLFAVSGRESRDLSPRFAFAQRRPKDLARHRRSWEVGEVFALQTLDFKYIRHTEGRDEFFDLARDPLELDNLIEEPSDLKDRMRDRLLAYFDELSSEPIDAEPGLPEEHEEELRALGYL